MKRQALILTAAALAALYFVPRVERDTSPPAPAPAVVRTLPLPVMAETPTSADVDWRTRSPLSQLAAFQSWSNDYTAQPLETKTAAGVQLAQERRSALKDLIRQDPALALASAVPEAVRRALPADVRALLEEKVDARGALIATAASGERMPAGKRAVRTEARLDDGRRLEAFVYGRREYQPSRADVPLHGIALDGLIAVSQWPGRMLEPVEAAEAKQALAVEPVCPTSGNKVSVSGTETVVLTGKSVRFYCGPGHAISVLEEAAQAETLRPPGLGIRQAAPVDAASGGAGQSVPGSLPEGNHAWTTGTKRILAVRVKFASYTDGAYSEYSDLSEGDCVNVVKGIREAYLDWSYGRLEVLPVQNGGSKVSPFVHLNHRAAEYEGDEIGDIWDEVKEKVRDNYNINPDNYDYILVLAGDAPITDEDDDTKTVWWGGLGRIGEGLAFIRVNDDTWTTQQRIDANVNVSLHEIGHNLGLAHSSNIFTQPQFINGSIASTSEYAGLTLEGRGGGRGGRRGRGRRVCVWNGGCLWKFRCAGL